MTKFSIIIPYYNSFDKIHKVFNSLFNQSYKNFEVLIIDDKSTDESFEDLKKYVTSLPLNVVLLQNKINSGPGVSRNYGIDNSKGEYILFIDSDDYVDNNLLFEIHKIISECSYDLILFDSYFEKKDRLSLTNFNYGLKCGQNEINCVLVQVSGITQGKCYKSSIIKDNHIRFISIRRGEDSPFFRSVAAYCKNAYYIAKPLYYYVQHESSLMHQHSRSEIDEISLAFKQIELNVKNKFPTQFLQLSSRELIYTSVCSYMSKNHKRKEIINLINDFNKQYIGWYVESLNYKKKKYLSVFLWCIHKKNISIIFILLKLRQVMIYIKR